MPALSQTCAIAAMAKAPRVGEVKTRLSPSLSPKEAAALSAAFIQDIAGNILAAAEAAAIDGFVAYSPPGSEAAFAGLLPEAIRLLPPHEIGLGASLLHAADDLLAAGYGAACLVNADSPNLPTAFLVEAAQALQKHGDRVVLGPAEDGGYYLIGLKRSHFRLFEDIAWSTERVFDQTLDRAAELGLETIVLPSWYDVDGVESLDRLRREILVAGISGAYAAPHTARLLHRFAAEPGAVRTTQR